MPGGLQMISSLLVLSLLAVSANWLYQVIRKPSELFFPVSDRLHKTPAQTWRAYAPIFRQHSTAIVSPELLAALAQTEGSGNPVARTYWRFSMTLSPFDLYRPASSAVGMYQITRGTFAEARHYCIRNHQLVAAGAWHDFDACWFNSLYTRVIPSHAVELTSAHLHRYVLRILARHRIGTVSGRQLQDLAALIHLCGAGAASAYAGRGFMLTPGQRCGDHDPRAYLAKVNALVQQFGGLNAAD